MAFCKECMEECEVVGVDFGIGLYEFWGSRGVHTDKRPVSDCCEAPCYESKEQDGDEDVLIGEITELPDNRD